MSGSVVPQFAIPPMFLDASTPVFFDEGLDTWHVFAYPDVVRVLKGYDEFGMEYGDPDVHPSYGAMWFRDPPRHTDLRALTDDKFHLAAVRDLVPVVERVVDGLLGKVAPAGRAEILADLAQPLPALVICEILGLDFAESMQFLGWLREEHHLVTLGDFSGKPEMIAALAELLRSRRDGGRPGIINDLLSAYEAGYLVDGQPLSERDLLGYVYMLLSASFGATTTAIGNYLLAIVQFDLWKQLQDEPALIGGAVEESLRWDTPMPALRTQAKVDITIGGQHVEAGQYVTGWMSAANRDPAAFDQPSRFDIHRRPNRHLSFGRGIHYCLGAELGRLEMKIFTERLLRRVPLPIGLDPDVPAQRTFGLLHGVAQGALVFPPTM